MRRPAPANGGMLRLVASVEHHYGAIHADAGRDHAAALEQLWRLAYQEASTWLMQTPFSL